jgi:hypothetical protein
VGRRSRATPASPRDRPRGAYRRALIARSPSSPAEAGISDILTDVAPAGAPEIASPPATTDNKPGLFDTGEILDRALVGTLDLVERDSDDRVVVVDLKRQGYRVTIEPAA